MGTNAKCHKDCVTILVEALKSGSVQGNMRLCYSVSGLAPVWWSYKSYKWLYLLIVLSSLLPLHNLNKEDISGEGKKAKTNAFLHKAEETFVPGICVVSEQRK